MKLLYWLLGATIIAAGVYISIMLGDTQKTVPKITLSYFADENEVARAIAKRLDQEIGQNRSFWIGIEPDKNEHLAVIQALKMAIERKNGPFDEMIVDSELKLISDFLQSVNTSQYVQLKDNLDAVGTVLQKLEQQNKKYLFVTAALYTNSFIKENQIHQLREKYKINPMTISFGFFPATADEESEALFPCSTENKSGASDWGCALINKSRSIRRKFDKTKLKAWSGVMDLTGENDYMFLLRKK